jgi:hypothetical protein
MRNNPAIVRIKGVAFNCLVLEVMIHHSYSKASWLLYIYRACRYPKSQCLNIHVRDCEFWGVVNGWIEGYHLRLSLSTNIYQSTSTRGTDIYQRRTWIYSNL